MLGLRWGYQVKINQLNFSYNSLEDRLLFRFNTSNNSEFRMWLTRAMCIQMVVRLRDAVKVTLQREQPGVAAVAMETVGEFRREAVLAKADFVQPFSAAADKFPMGPQPLLVTGIGMDTSGMVPVLTFHIALGKEVNLSLNHDLGVSIGKLLCDVVESLDWGIGLAKEIPLAETGNLSENKMMLH
jgi:hypothetical protein